MRFGAGVADDGVGRDVVIEDLFGLLGDNSEVLDLAEADGVVEGVGGGDGADEDEHDEAHALLAVVGAVTEADAAAGEDEERANPEGRRLGAFRRLVQGGVFDEELEEKQEDRSQAEADQRRNQQNFEDAGGLLPVDAAGAGMGIHELIGDADADDGADKGVGAGSGRPNHQVLRFQMMAAMRRAKTMAKPAPLPTCRISSTGQQRNNGEGDSAGGGEHADEVPEAGLDDGDMGLKRMRVDDGGDGIGGVMEAVDEFETESDEQGEAQQGIGPGGGEVGSGKIVRKLLSLRSRGRR